MNNLFKLQQREGAQKLEAGWKAGDYGPCYQRKSNLRKEGTDTLGNEFMLIIPSVGGRLLPDTQPPLTQGSGERRRESRAPGAAHASPVTALGLSFLITEMGRPFPALLSASNKQTVGENVKSIFKNNKWCGFIKEN